MITEEVNSYDLLILGGNVKTSRGTLEQSETPYVRGTVLAKLSDDLYGVCKSDHETEVNQTPNCILLEDVDATESSVDNIAILLAGDVETSQVVTMDPDTTDTHKESLRALSIYLK
ncbi:head decoration protein [Spirochaeta cellobiosiphila]|uniref:head decoration protein n=1 Tax=Spirochaeta cellobiosiphila TaxID=504483 RepID=UPI0003FD36AE|nr:head decoration protein [Spirochaeta cellobiosiphila]